jgi:hypothetical protein
VRLRWPKSSADGNEQSNDEYSNPAHLVVPKERNIHVIDNEIHRHTQYEQKDKTVHLGSRQGSAEDESYSYYDCAPSDNSSEYG